MALNHRWQFGPNNGGLDLGYAKDYNINIFPQGGLSSGGPLGNHMKLLNTQTSQYNIKVLNKQWTISLFMMPESATFTVWSDVITFFGKSSGTSGSVSEFRLETVNTSGTEYSWFGDGYIVNGAGGINVGTLPILKWSHIAVSYDGNNTVKSYVNGSLVAIHTTPYTGIYIDSIRLGNAGMYVSINDVMIHDEELSQFEIYWISKGKMLHWPLNSDFLVNTTNIANNSSGEKAWSTTSYVNISDVEYNGKNAWRITYNSSTTFRFHIPYLQLINGEKYTISFNYKLVAGTLAISDFCDTALLSQEMNGRYLYASGTRATYDSVYNFFDFIISPTTDLYIWNVQVEKGTYATPYTAYNRTAEYNVTDLANSIPGILSNPLNYDSNNGYSMEKGENTPPVNKYYLFNDHRIQNEDYFISNFMGDMDEWSVSIWAKAPSLAGSNDKPIIGTSVGEPNGFYIRINGSNILASYGIAPVTLTSSAIITNKWYHICLTYSKVSGGKLYINGILASSSATTSSISSTSNSFGLGYNDVNLCGLYLSDARMYGRTLNQYDITYLYSGKMAFDNRKGKLFVSNINSSLPSVSRKTFMASNNSSIMADNISEIALFSGKNNQKLLTWYKMNDIGLSLANSGSGTAGAISNTQLGTYILEDSKYGRVIDYPYDDMTGLLISAVSNFTGSTSHFAILIDAKVSFNYTYSGFPYYLCMFSIIDDVDLPIVAFGIDGTGQLGLDYGASGGLSLFSNNMIDIESWNNYMFVLKTDNISGTIYHKWHAYVNGDLIGISSPVAGYAVPSTFKILIGNKSSENTLNSFDGYLSDLKIYNLNENEALQLIESLDETSNKLLQGVSSDTSETFIVAKKLSEKI